MNLLEINAEKLYEILRTSPEKGLDDRQVQLNRNEFSPETSRKRLGLREISQTLFGDVMLVLFFLLSLFWLDVREDSSAGVCVLLLLISYFAFRIFASLYVRRVDEKIAPYRRSQCKVLRDGVEQSVDYSKLVPGDILILKKGDIVPCDALVIKQKTLRVLEIQLTGNASPVVKLTQEDVLSGKGCPYYECILFAGSVISYGEAVALVCNVGDSIFDKRNKLVSRVRSDNRPKIYEKALLISNRISLVWVLLCIVTVIAGIVKGVELFSLFYIVTTLSVAVLPDLILTLSELNLATATLRLLKKGAAVKNLSAIDRMCDINCMAVDSSRYFRATDPKPHTVIVNGEKKRFKNASDKDVRKLFELAVIACAGGTGAREGMTYNEISVEKCLIDTAERLGMPQKSLYEKYLMLERLPFTYENGMSRVIVYYDGRFYLVCLGTCESILRVCSAMSIGGINKNFFEKDKIRLLEDSKLIAADNEGMVAVCVKDINYHEGMGQIDNPRGSVFMGFIGLHTAIIADAAKAVNECDKSGIDILLMTNEPRATSVGFADSLSIMKSGEKAIDNVEFSNVDEGLFRADIKKYKVFLSFDGEEKGSVVRYRKSDGDIVASTASSIEEIPLQLESDVSFCLSRTREDAVVRNSDVVLINGFGMVLECIKFARCVYRNIRHMLEFLMLSQFSLASCAFMFLTFLPSVGFSPMQIILYSVFVFMPLAFVLSCEKVRGTELKASFGEENININFQNLITVPLICGLATGFVTTLSSRIGASAGLDFTRCRAMAFITLGVAAVLMAFSITSDSTVSMRIFKNKYLMLSVPFVIGAVLLLSLAAPFSHVLRMSAPEHRHILTAILLGFVPCILSFAIKAAKKFVLNNYNNKGE